MIRSLAGPVYRLLLTAHSVVVAVIAALRLQVTPMDLAFVIVPLVIVACIPVVVPPHLGPVMIVVRLQIHRDKQSGAENKST